MKKIVSMFLALTMCLFPSVPAFAVESPVENTAEEANEDMLLELSEVDEDNIPLEIMEKYYSLTEEEVEEILAQHDEVIPSACTDSVSPQNATEAINQLAAQATQTFGPFTKIYAIPVDYMEIIVQCMAANLNRKIYPQSYNGKSCYLFSNGTTNVYVEAAAFCSTSENLKTYPADTAVSKTLTSYTNNNNFDHLCSTRVRCIRDDSLGYPAYYWTVAQLATKSFTSGGNYRILKSSILSSIYFTVSFDSLSAYSVD